ncbi:GTPase HflX [Solemya pervernicosa gill symbiont]|uniref:GTPase HflX n=2 Tax=Gammaproteobacteria incertae sedis TaxID=118884 RepID=A0A1T2L7S3_9GAMM|nr:ribosome rescue GTPase HflX [Candidatus Reidiella endopervernicosa]OOZ41084.1 GTPase HflX [Solemya pervernicosa gill symbiont]QKQ26245.1 GTPase HflX [Candidatus Reidiella endopervernicosa]
MFERPRSGERAVLVHLDIPPDCDARSLEEFRDLARSAGADPVATITGSRDRPDAKYFVGSGKAEEIKLCVDRDGVELVLVDHALSPSQERNLESMLQCRVLDRAGLILDIFAQRARSFEGKLQVELAQLRHLSTRLVRGWTHLERQKGGIGLRGPGETQLETDRRLLGARIKTLNGRLEKVERQRHQGRRARNRAEVPTVSLVGYTNTGKSTLFNKVTGAAVYAKDQLFATLDPTLRRLDLPQAGSVVLADTVGFVRQLPHDLVAAFRSTLQETREADLLLHIIDAHDEERDSTIAEVNSVLEEIGADEVPQIEVFNKIDLADASPRIQRDEQGRVRRVWLSAVTGEGLELLIEALAENFINERVVGETVLTSAEGRLRAQLFQLDAVEHEAHDEQGGWRISINMPKRDFERLQRESGLCLIETVGEKEERLAAAAQGQ